MNRLSKLSSRVMLLLLLGGASSVNGLMAQTWNNSGTDWGTASNWQGGAVPTSSGGVIFSGSEVYNPDLGSTNYSIRSLTFSSTAGNYTIESTGGGVLTLDAQDSTSTFNRFYISSGSQTINTDMIITNSLNSSKGTRIYYGANNVGLTLAANRTLTIGSAVSISNDGGNTSLTANNIGTFNVYGTINTGGNLFTSQAVGSSVYFRSSAHLISSGSGGYGNSAGNTYFETSDIGGSITLAGSYVADAGLYISANGLTMTNAIRITNTGDQTTRIIGSSIAGGGVATWSGTITLSGNTGATTFRTVQFNAASDNRVNFTGNLVQSTGSTFSTGLQITGSGVVVISGSGNTYNIATTVTTGSTLLVNNSSGSATGISSVIVNGILGGTGHIAPGSTNSVTVNSGGVVAPGDGGIGTLEFNLSGTTGTATFASGASFSFDLAAPGVSDLLSFTGLTSASAVQFNGNTLTFSRLGGLAEGTYKLFSFDLANGYSGTLASGSYDLGSGFIGTLSYQSNEIDLVVTSVPEPSIAIMLMVSGLLVGVQCRRREKVASVLAES